MADPKSTLLKGGLGAIKRLLSSDEQLTAAQRAEAGRRGAELIKSQQQVNPSEALGQLMEKGFTKTATTQADRTRVGGGNIGGAPFSAISEADPAYAGKVWGVMDEGTAKRLTNLTTPETAWTTMLGSANQLKTNPIVFDKLKRGFQASMKEGNLSPELEAKINHNLALTFGEGANIRDPGIWKQADTFEKRAALADLMMGQGIAPKKGGLSLGGEKSGKGVIFKPTDILKRETEPSLMHTEHSGDVPTFAAGPRLFKLEKETEYRPDLHPGFPTLIGGKDLGYNVKPAPTEVYLPDWHAKFKKDNPERYPPFKTEKQGGPGYYDLALGVKGEGLPSQKLNDEYIRHLLREGFKDGGEVNMDEADARLKAAIGKHMAKGGEVDLDAADARLSDAVSRHMAGGGGAFKQIQFKTEDGVAHMAPGGLMKIGKRLFGGADELTPATKGGTRRFGEEMGGTNIVKEPGGNWLGGDVEKQLKKLQMGETVPPEFYADRAKYLTEATAKKDERAQRAIKSDVESAKRNDAMNKWVESNLTNYVKKQMGTQDDPVRALAEQGVLHMEPYGTREAGSLTMRKRAGLNYPAQGVGQSEKAKFWERLSDSDIESYPAGSYKHGALDESIMRDNPWLSKVPDETMIHSGKGMHRDLGFDHIMDVLREDVAAGRIRPEQLNKVSMEQAVRRTYEYDQEMARRMAEAQFKVTEGMPVHKDYGGKGYKWLELNNPKDSSATESALKYEGNTMGHCVGSYCDDVTQGKSRIYSLRDAKGEPHVTIETRKGDFSKAFGKLSEEEQKAVRKVAGSFASDEDLLNAMKQVIPEKADIPESIIQIKGKQNAAPKEDYLPFVQDFVKSGKWSDIGDFRNTGLIREGDQIMTPAEHADWLLKQLGVAPEGMAEGGAAFKKLSFYDKGGITTSGGDFSAEDIDPSVRHLPKDIREDIAKGALSLEDEFGRLKKSQRAREQLAKIAGAQAIGTLPDIANIGLLGVDFVKDLVFTKPRPRSVLEGPYDPSSIYAHEHERVPRFGSIAEALQTKEGFPIGGTEHIIKRAQEAGLMGPSRFPVLEFPTAMFGGAGAAKAINATGKGLAKVGKEYTKYVEPRINPSGSLSRAIDTLEMEPIRSEEVFRRSIKPKSEKTQSRRRGGLTQLKAR